MNPKKIICELPEIFRRPLIELISYSEVVIWRVNGKPFPLPHKIKTKIILDFAKIFNLTTLVETGTYLGQTVDDLKNHFAKIYSIELDNILFKEAKKMFIKNKNIKIIQGDSGAILNKLIKSIDTPSLFWLDAHYSGGITARGLKNTPIIKEIGAVSKSKIKNHIILIDDAREFKGVGDYPTIKQIRAFVTKNYKNYKIEVKDDIIRIYPLKEYK